MARTKQYNEQEVIEKAMSLFWRNGYENTSVRMLEKEMGINQFSIYASFGCKQGVFLESIKSYKAKLNIIFDKLHKGTDGVSDIKQFFYDSVNKPVEFGNNKGCLITNTYNEFAGLEDQLINEQMVDFMNKLKEVFIQKLRMDPSKDEETIHQQANYLVLAKHGLAAASRVNTKKEIDDYIDLTFKNI
ncbi:TetR/AcrR family transcriptional regulator [Flavobacterium cellulosilyticum]|uniref:TetR/AcrR family transcriptional regulator n=1 Tax=Flavobacterium cellulosilyticum TaxID=2541731 RepID=A0A4R5CJB0_9FLAO|nr:TetR/AcrR family transcriptional regulator [Flavobacterium cellulosilyticum]TDD98690.1 TetR/AcrR family transcriptional regulator [Flavobacterium cellulosilyticum]